jgi:putative tricarboxylic transport membrane protein
MNVAGRGISPYVIVLLITLFLFYEISSQLDFVAPAGRPGPDIWPRLVLLLAALVCVYEIVRRLVTSPEPVTQASSSEELIVEGPGEETGTSEKVLPKYPGLVVAGVLLSVGYVALLGTMGFFLCTTLFLAAFMLLGGYRRFVTIAVSSVVGGLVFMFTFMKVVYVSLPLGVEPFSQVSLALMRLMNIR